MHSAANSRKSVDGWQSSNATSSFFPGIPSSRDCNFALKHLNRLSSRNHDFARTAVCAASISTASMCDTPQARHSKIYEDTDIKRSAKNLDTALCRVSEASTREIENLVDEFHHLDKKLQADLSRIQRDIAEYAELSKGVMQLATTISDGMKKTERCGHHSII